MKHTKQQIQDHIKQVLIELFELEEAQLTPHAKLYDDLDIDSIDTIDLLIELKKFIGKDIDPKAFQQATSLEDVTNIIHQL